MPWCFCTTSVETFCVISIYIYTSGICFPYLEINSICYFIKITTQLSISYFFRSILTDCYSIRIYHWHNYHFNIVKDFAVFFSLILLGVISSTVILNNIHYKLSVHILSCMYRCFNINCFLSFCITKCNIV